MPTAYVEAGRIAVSGSAGFLDQIEKLLTTIAKTTVGASLIGYFHDEAYAVQAEAPARKVALGITEYKKPAFGSPKPPIETQTCITWRDQPARPLGISNDEFMLAPKIPFVRFPGPGFKQDPLSVVDGVLHGHKDFAEGTPLDVVLAHELCHAYLSAAGISKIWEDGKHTFTSKHAELSCETTGIYTAVEEQIVCGLLAGRGLYCCENSYRMELGHPLRTTYLDVGIKDVTLGNAVIDGTAADVWSESRANLDELAKTWGSPIAVVLHKNHWPDAKKDFAGAVEATARAH